MGIEFRDYHNITGMNGLKPGTLLDIGTSRYIDEFVDQMAWFVSGQANFHLNPLHNIGRGMSHISVRDIIEKSVGIIQNSTAVVLSSKRPEILKIRNMDSIQLQGIDLLIASEKYKMMGKVLKRILIFCLPQDNEQVYLMVRTVNTDEMDEVANGLDIDELQSVVGSLKVVCPKKEFFSRSLSLDARIFRNELMVSESIFSATRD